jgi:hypothetical protein
METLDYPSWRWGLSLIALTLAFHAAFVVMMGIVAIQIRARLETRSLDLWKLVPITGLTLQRHWQLMGALE